MTRRTRAAVGAVALIGILSSAQAAGEQGHHTPADASIELSPELAALLSEEMLAIEEGIGSLVVAMAAGNWPGVAETSEKIEKSYILAQRLSAEQRAELQQVLPSRFKLLDQAFHQAAGKLARAAEARDSESAVFQTYKLMDACVTCHATYAGKRYPGFSKDEEAEHH